eukprot:jgi/Mesvir1/10757/Mv13826-RA.1
MPSMLAQRELHLSRACASPWAPVASNACRGPRLAPGHSSRRSAHVGKPSPRKRPRVPLLCDVRQQPVSSAGAHQRCVSTNRSLGVQRGCCLPTRPRPGPALAHRADTVDTGSTASTDALAGRGPDSPASAASDAGTGAGVRGARRMCQLYVLDGLTPYEPAWALQKEMVRVRVATRREGPPLPDALVVLQHPPVYTLGTGSSVGHLKFDAATPPNGAQLYRTERGGEVTYHGPGQIVMYPILDLQSHHTADLHLYLRQLEEVVISALMSAVGLPAGRVEGLTGVWHDGAKLAAIGVRATSWVTYHGLALNVTTDLAPFDQIVPCGIADRAPHLGDDEWLLAHVRAHLLAAFAQVFDVELEAAAPLQLASVTRAAHGIQDASTI